MTKKQYQRYSPEFKLHALKRASEDGVTDKDICEELGMSRRQLRRWRDQYRLLGDEASEVRCCSAVAVVGAAELAVPVPIGSRLVGSIYREGLPVADAQVHDVQDLHEDRHGDHHHADLVHEAAKEEKDQQHAEEGVENGAKEFGNIDCF